MSGREGGSSRKQYSPSHQDIDRRSLALHKLVAEKIRKNPELFEIAKNNVVEWRKIKDRSQKSYIDEWERILESGVDAALEVVTEDASRARRLRQSSPFAGVLTEEERLSFLKKWREGES